MIVLSLILTRELRRQHVGASFLELTLSPSPEYESDCKNCKSHCTFVDSNKLHYSYPPTH